jgi:iron-sulfur cluster repair protein YtfE (RIC family)
MHVFPGELRRVFLDEHARLRVELATLEGLLARATDAAVVDELRQRVRGFAAEILAHMAHEERVLRPLLADETWGHQRVSVMDADHAAQRKQMLDFEPRLAGPVEAWRAQLQQLIAAVRSDMASEEKEALGG